MSINVDPRFEPSLARYRIESEALVRREQIGDAVKSPRYHYTSLATLPKILSSGEIWCTDYRFQHDPLEFAHGVALVRSTASRLKAQHRDARLHLFLDCAVDMLESNELGQALRVFICCFSRTLDDIGQWVRFADDGRGCALIFKRSFFALEEPQPYKLRSFQGPVSYPSTRVSKRILEALSIGGRVFIDGANEHADAMRDKSIGYPFMKQLALEMLALPLIWQCLTTKQFAYRSERETRLALLGLPPIFTGKIRAFTRADLAVPYVPLPFDPGDIGGVVLGPAAPAGAESQVSAMLKATGVSNPTIKRSTIQYRAV